MAITVNSVGVATGNNGTTAPACSYLKSTSDELLIVWLASDAAETISSMSDNSAGGSLTWQSARNDLNNAPGATIWWAVSDGVAETITITATTSSGQFIMCAAGISGCDTTTPIDATAGNAGTSSTPSVSLTTNNANSLVVLLCASDDSDTLSWTPGGAPTEAFFKTTGGGNKSGGLGGYELQATAGAATHSVTVAKGATIGWRMVGIELIEAAEVSTAYVYALESYLTYGEKTANVYALESYLTYDELTAYVYALEAYTTYDIKTAYVYALESYLTYTASSSCNVYALEAYLTYTVSAGQSASEDFTSGTWPKTDWEEGFGWATGRTSDINVNDALQPNAVTQDHVNRRTDTWDATNQSCTIEWGCGDSYTGQVAPFITAIILSQNDASFFAAAMGSAGSGNFIELYEVTSGNVWTPKPDAASKYLTGDLNNGCRVRLTYDGTDITVDYYNGSTWTNGVITWTRDVGNTTGTPGIVEYSRTSDPAEVSYWEASAGGAASEAYIYALEAYLTYGELTANVYALESYLTYDIKQAYVYALEAYLTYTTVDPTAYVYALEAYTTYDEKTAHVYALEAYTTYDELTAYVYALEGYLTYTETGATAYVYALEAKLYYSDVTEFPSQTSGHRLQDGNGNDLFFIADSPWSLFQRLNTTDRDTYLNDRAARGVNAVLIRSSTVGGEVFGDPAPIDLTDYEDWQGNAPYTSITDWSSPVDAYWDNVAAGVQKCWDLGITVFLTASYCGYNAEQGWSDEMTGQSNAQMEAWGEYLGWKFSKYPNIVWVHSGDHTPNATVKERIEAIRTGIARYAPWHLNTLHCSGGGTGRTDWGSDPSWLHIDSAYSYEPEESTWIKTAYDDTPTMPAVYIEGRYEDAASNPSDIQLRRQMWWPLLGGMAGAFYAHNECWNFQAAVAFGINGDWANHYQDPGADFLQYLAARARADLVPDYSNAILTAGQGTLGTTDYALAAKSDDNNVVMAYTPSQKQLTFDLTSMTGAEVDLKWINPATNAETSIGTGITQAAGMQYTPPSAGDWVFYAETSQTRGTVYALEAYLTYGEKAANVYALEAYLTYDELTGYVYALEAYTTYDELTAYVYALEAYTTYDELQGYVYALEAYLTYTESAIAANVYALEAYLTYDEVTQGGPTAFEDPDVTTEWTSTGANHWDQVELIIGGSDATNIQTTTADAVDQFNVGVPPSDIDTCHHIGVDVRGIIEDSSEAAVIAVSLWASAIQQGSTKYISGTDFGGYGVRGTAPELLWSDLDLTQAQCNALQVRWQALTAAP